MTVQCLVVFQIKLLLFVSSGNLFGYIFIWKPSRFFYSQFQICSGISSYGNHLVSFIHNFKFVRVYLHMETISFLLFAISNLFGYIFIWKPSRFFYSQFQIFPSSKDASFYFLDCPIFY